MKKTACFCFLVSGFFLLLFLGIFNYQVHAGNVENVGAVIEQITPEVVKDSDSSRIKAFFENALLILAGLGTVVTALAGFLVLLFGKFKELKASYAEMTARQNRQTDMITETHKTIVDVALKTPAPSPVTDNSIHLNESPQKQ